MSEKHTPGPWHIGMKPGPMIYGPKGEQIADMRPDRAMVPDDENRANARLIAAAPELLAALEMIATQKREGDIPQQVVRMQRIARAAIAKAAE